MAVSTSFVPTEPKTYQKLLAGLLPRQIQQFDAATTSVLTIVPRGVHASVATNSQVRTYIVQKRVPVRDILQTGLFLKFASNSLEIFYRFSIYLVSFFLHHNC